MNELLEVYQAAYDRYAAANKSAPSAAYVLAYTGECALSTYFNQD